MRQSLIDLIERTIIYQYDLPNNLAGIEKTIFSTANDKCYSATDKTDIANIIYNSIIEYSFNEFDLDGKNYNNLQSIALRNKLKYNPDIAESEKIKYGFFGEVMLYSILLTTFNANPLIARGYFYNPLENSETKGYDSYQLVENNGRTELWFGEVKFHICHIGAIKSVLSNIEKALSDSYFEKNIIAIHNHKNNLNISGSVIETILNNWEENPSLKIIDEINRYNMKLVYPILLMYEDDKTGYDQNVMKVITHIIENYETKTFSLSFDFSVFFILLPIEAVKDVKLKVIEWIELKQPLI